ncbi:MAG: HAMP domain-containing histidine kinase [Sphingobacteriales bacterium]|nr:MAG: HAMP domain-containing histidine kinase [Sphingobacteriales bacterium]
MSKLLNKPFKAFSIYALIILMCSIPVYYLVIDFIWLQELDEHNLIIKKQILNNFNKNTIEEIELNSLLKNWNKLQPNTTLTPSNITSPKSDSTYTISKQNEYVAYNEINRFRVLSSYIIINNKIYHLQVESNVEETDETMLAIAFVTLLFFIALVIGFIFLNRRIAKQIWQPFRNTLEKLKSFDLTTQQTISFDKTDIEEFEDLNQSLRNLIDKNISVYTQQKTFIENASHELQTPLAVLKSKIDVLLQNEQLSNEQAEIINAIELPLSRVTRINKNLLLLAKIENNQFSDKENIELTEMINESIEMLSDYIEAKQISVGKNLKEKFSLTCNKTLLEILINNLLINAIVHNVENGKINIEFCDRKLSISNIGKSALDNTKIFDRFIVSSSENTNSGLGLAITKEICHRYNWNIQYTFENNFHSFVIKF